MSEIIAPQDNPSPKNIVLLSDGTGNSSSKQFKTNVWRLYQALDLSNPAKQVAFYDDGVGTSSNKYIAAVTGVFGYGLKRNVLHMYCFLCRNYQPNDRIYAFGFSRGSFTMRVLIGMVVTQGLAPSNGCEKQLANDAKAAYRRFRKNFKTTFRIEKPLRALRDLWYSWRDPRSKTVRFNADPKRDPDWIHFAGLWDTVDAYGGPIEEITDAIDYWIWPLSMPDQIMSHKIRRACHALALDDERRAFWPRLWREDVIKDRDGKALPFNDDPHWKADAEKAARDAIIRDGLLALRGPDGFARDASVPEVDTQRLTQVWFTGMHCDVGGSYPQDGLSHVTLDWMMDRAITYGLHVQKNEEQRLRACANSFDKLNDSRSGPGVYYRYQPRNLDILRFAGAYSPLCARVWNMLVDSAKKLFGWTVPEPEEIARPSSPPLVHESVLKRIDAGANAYAPITLPADYWFTGKDGVIHRGPYPRPATRPGTFDEPPVEHERVFNLVWARRVVYFTTVLVSAFVVLFPFINEKWLKLTPTGLGDKYLVPAMRWLEGWVPKIVDYWYKPAMAVPEYVVVGAILLLLLILRSGYLQECIGDAMRQLWRKRFGQNPAAEKHWAAPWTADSSFVYWLRTRAWYRELFAALRHCIFPTILVWGPILYLIGHCFPSTIWIIWILSSLWAFINVVCLIVVSPEKVPGARA